VNASTSDIVDAARRALGAVILGKPEVIDLLLVGVLAAGHVLVEDVPGVGKTTLAKALARCFRMAFTRVQFTPDLLPSDILGSQVLQPRDGTFVFHKGPLFTNVLLADEINRASPRTQSALLEAMNEGQATIDGITHPLPDPFLVIATQNPADYQGTYPLPEAQLDRFMIRLAVGYPAIDAELKMLEDRRTSSPLQTVETIADQSQLLAMQAEVREVRVKEPLSRYMLQIVAATRRHADIELGVSPRGSLSLFRASQARALLDRRMFVQPGDVQAVALPVLAHRLLLTPQARYGGTTSTAILKSLVDSISVPT
jgi:MoxR-like ATPase